MASDAAAGRGAVVIDSNVLIAWYNTRDGHHSDAARAMAHVAAGSWGKVLLLEYVFLEVVTVLLARLGAAAAVLVGRALLESDEFTFVPCSELFLDAWREFSASPDSTLSFADAAIAVAARTLANGRVATFDSDFRSIAGLSILPA